MTEIIPMRRSHGRSTDGLRPVTIEPNAIPHAEGSAYIKVGDTHVLCAATVEEGVPRWKKGDGTGWVTAEYAMLPRSTPDRIGRESVSGKQGGRTVEIQRLIGRSLRSVTDLKVLGERQITLDCDVIRADGGTRCAAITGAYVSLALACARLQKEKRIRSNPLRAMVAAVSVGVVRGVPLLDLDYAEDSKADVDANIVMTDGNAFVEIQGTAEKNPFAPSTLDLLLALASIGLDELFSAQRVAIAEATGM
ncbi:MAG TPA: ribonuclease PH [Thermomicrobiales bacterium]|nr:ribonuclease PH [Thermomicrobiales bacterium]